MHILFRERHGLEEAAQAEDLAQAPADLVVLSFSDSDLSAFAAGWHEAGGQLPSLRLANLNRLLHPLSVDLYCEKTLAGSKAILIRLLGGTEYWPYGVEQVRVLARANDIALAIIPGDGRDDPRLSDASNLPVSTLARLKTLCDKGGPTSARMALAQMALATGLAAPAIIRPRDWPAFGIYGDADVATADRPGAFIVFYRSFLVGADTDPVDRLIEGFRAAGFTVRAVFLPSLKDPDAATWLVGEIDRHPPDLIVNVTAFSARGKGGTSPFDACDAPVLQVALAASSRDEWQGAERGLSPTDLAMHVVLPEIDGRIFAGVASFKEAEPADAAFGFARKSHRADAGRIGQIVARGTAIARLRRTPVKERRLAIVLSTYPGRDDQLAHAVGLDAPASTLAALRLLKDHGYTTDRPPETGEILLGSLVEGGIDWPVADYLAQLSLDQRARIDAVWGDATSDPDVQNGAFAFRAMRCGNVVVALQPERSRRDDRQDAYHDPRREPRHAYVAFYLWLRHLHQAHAMIHMGAHGTLEWLPGKSVALSQDCWPEMLLGPVPVIYPFVVNDPGEAAAAKRRLGAVTIGHMTPPLRTAALPEGLVALEHLLDEYSTADGLDPRRRGQLSAGIIAAARDVGLDRDAGLGDDMAPEDAITRLDAFVCDIKATQYLDGFHVFGEATTDAAGTFPLEACAAAERTALLAALDGRAIAPGPAGSPWRGRLDVMPTGRNLFSVDPRGVPSQTAHRQGARLAAALLTRHLQDEGAYPRSVVVDLWGSATMRTGGEDFAMALTLMGVKPEWDLSSGRVSGFEIITLAALGRPRIDVTLRISGLFRDVFPGLPALFAQTVAVLAQRDEDPNDNPFIGTDTPRVFSPAPGGYGVAMGDHLGDLTPQGLKGAGEAWLAGSAHAIGTELGAAEARAALEQRTAAADAYVHTQDLPETDLLLSPDYAAHEAGFAAAARRLTGKAPALYHADVTSPDAQRVRTLNEEVARVVRGRAANPQWIAGQMRHGYRGAAEIASTLDQLAAFAHLAEAAGSHLFDLYYDATLGRDDVRAFLAEANPKALDEMRKRFRDLIAAGHWRPRRNSVAADIAVPVLP